LVLRKGKRNLRMGLRQICELLLRSSYTVFSSGTFSAVSNPKKF